MKNLFNVLEQKVLPVINKAGANKYLVALRNGIAAIIPFTIIGSLFLIITNFPSDAWKELIADYIPMLNVPYNVCMGLLAIVAVFSIAYNLSKELKINPLPTGFVALVSFVLTQTNIDGVIDTTNFGSTGLFLAIVVAIITAKIVELFDKRNLTIKLPDSVPTMVADSFKVLIPGFVTILLFWILTTIAGLDLNNMLSSIFSPFVQSLNTLPGMLLIVFISLLLWCCGINESIISGLTYPVWYALLAENTAAYQAGEAVLNAGAYGFQYFGFWMGGTGATIGLVILMFRSKAKVYNSLGKLSLAPALFNINEPIVFGYPIVFNPVMMIPYVTIPLITTTLTYLAMTLGIIGMPVAAIPWTTPPVLSGFLVTGGDVRAAVFQFGMIILSVVIYYPFFKYTEKQQLLEQEAEAIAEN